MNTEQLIKLESSLGHKLDRDIEKNIWENISRGHNNAGDIGFECDTYQVLCRLRGHLKPKISVGTAKIFRIGKEWEEPNIDWMRRSKVDVIEAGDPDKGRRRKKWIWEKYNIVGYMDALIKVPEICDRYLPLEMKTISPEGLKQVIRHKERGIPLTQARQPWVRKYPGQLTTYMLFREEEFGVWFYFQKLSGDFLWWIMPLDFNYGETLIQRAERTEESVAKKKIPKPKECELCNGCDFSLTYCFTDKDYGPGFTFMSEKELEKKLGRWDETKEAFSEHKRLDKELKSHFEGKNVFTKRFQITSKKVERDGYTVKPFEYWDTRIKRLDEAKEED